MDVIAYCLSKKYSNKVGSTIIGTNYDYDTSKLIFNTENGDWTVTVNNGMNAGYKQTLDNVTYDSTNDVLEVNGQKVLTVEDTVSDDDDLNFDGFFD